RRSSTPTPRPPRRPTAPPRTNAAEPPAARGVKRLLTAALVAAAALPAAFVGAALVASGRVAVAAPGAALASGTVASGAVPDPAQAQDPAVAALLTAGAEAYALRCAVCHGSTGGGIEEARLAFPPDERRCTRCHRPS